MTEAATASAPEAGSVANAEAAPAPVQPSAPAESGSDWKASLPEDIRDNPTLANYQTLEGLVKSHVNLEKMLGGDKIPVPKDGDEEGFNRAYKALGWPDAPTGYEFKAPEQVPEGMVYSPELDQQIAGIFHGAKLNKSQAAAVREGLMEIVGKGATDGLEASKVQQAEQQAAIQAAEQALKQEWGTAFEQRGKIAGAAINKFLSPETIAAMDAAGLANNPAIIKDMYNLGVKLAGEKELISSDGELASPADLDSQIADFRTKHSAALFDKSHADHAQRTKEYTALFNRRYPEQAA